jgi:hypothetical protein
MIDFLLDLIHHVLDERRIESSHDSVTIHHLVQSYEKISQPFSDNFTFTNSPPATLLNLITNNSKGERISY